MITAAKLLQLITIAAQLSGYPQPAPSVALPEVHEIGSKEIAFLSGQSHVVGLYIPVEHTIYIDVEWLMGSINLADGSYHYTEESYLVHELTHWLQDINGKFQGTDCPNPLHREQQAYSVQNMYEHKYEADRNPDPEGEHEVPPDTPCSQIRTAKPPHTRERPRHTRERTHR